MESDLPRAPSGGSGPPVPPAKDMPAESRESTGWWNLHNIGVRDEEPVRLVGGFDDLFIALATLLIFIGVLGYSPGSTASFFVVAGASIGLSEYFAKRVRLRLTSLLLAIATVVAAAQGLMALWGTRHDGLFYGLTWTWLDDFKSLSLADLVSILSAMLAGSAIAVAYWFRYQVPVAVALACAFLLYALQSAQVHVLELDLFRVSLLTYGLFIFAFAIYWDRRDPNRTKLASDVAFWLHLLAAPLVVNPIYTWAMGADLFQVAESGAPSDLALISVLVIYLALGLVALLVNRRVFVVAGLVYVIIALVLLLKSDVRVEQTVALVLTAMGLVFLVVAVLWGALHQALMTLLPDEIRKFLIGTEEAAGYTELADHDH